MTQVSDKTEILQVDLARYRLLPRGAIDLSPEDRTRIAATGFPAVSVLLVGHAGGAVWPHFRRWLEGQPPGLADPLDSWSRAVLDPLARQIGARAVLPSDRPYLPFQQWAMRAEGLRPSPLGILMHPEYGLWHAYRGALLFDQPLAEIFSRVARTTKPPLHRCDSCTEKPCLKDCPVAAHSLDRFDYAGCVGHVRSPRGGECRSGGCLDRNACPFGVEYRYTPEQQAFHMAAFAGL